MNRRNVWVLALLAVLVVVVLLVAGCGDDETDATVPPRPVTPLGCGTEVTDADDHGIDSTLEIHGDSGRATFTNKSVEDVAYSTGGTTPAVVVKDGKVASLFGAVDRSISAGTLRPGETIAVDVAVSTVGCDKKPLEGPQKVYAVLYGGDGVLASVPAVTS